MKPTRTEWSRAQRLAVLQLYVRTPFGKLHRSNPEIIALASAIGRTPSAVAMKASNFASLDPSIRNSGRTGLEGASQGDRDLWDEFHADSERIANEAEEAVEEFGGRPQTLRIPDGPTDVLRQVRVRRVQSFFRKAVLASYGGRCSLSGIRDRALLRASHIIPWSADPTRRADPSNGLCLNALFDQAFDRGLFTVDENYRVIVSRRLRRCTDTARLACSLNELAGVTLTLPEKFLPDLAALKIHRETIFRG